MMKKSLTVFLCSTYSDLLEERNAVLDGVRKLQLKHDSMEFFGARASLPIETCLQEVRKSDILVVIVGHKYGSLVPNTKISFSEAEYSEGYLLEKPCLVYLKDENVPILPIHIERDGNKLLALDKFKSLVRERHTVASYKDAPSLAVSVVADLSRTIQAIEEIKEPNYQKAHREGSIYEQINFLIQQAIESNISEKALLDSIRKSVKSLLSKEGKRRPLIFFSYSYSDKHFVAIFSYALQKEGIRVWDSENQIMTGDSLRGTIEGGIESADFMAFFVSKNSIDSKWANFELQAIITRRFSEEKGPIVFPILLDDTDIPGLLRDVKYLDLRDGDVKRGAKELAETIRRQMEKRI